MLNSLKINLFRKKWLSAAAAVILALGGVGLSHAASDSNAADSPPANAMFLQIAGVDGESTDAGHPKQIDVSAFDWGSGAPGIQASGNQGSGAGAGKVTINDIHITKHVDKSSPTLMQSAASGKHYDKVVLSNRKAGGTQDYLVVTMSDVVVTSYQLSGNSEGPTENITLNFTKVEFKQASQNTDGSFGNPVLGTISAQGNGNKLQNSQ